jgi:hypothetical protein
MELMGQLVRDASIVVNQAAWRMFAQEYDIPYPGAFCSDLIRIFTPNARAAKRLYKEQRMKLAAACRDWGQSTVEIFWSMNHNPIPVSASPINQKEGEYFAMSNEPIITVPTIEVGSLTVSPAVLNRILWMMDNPRLITGITRIHDEKQVVMSASSVALLTTTTLKQAVNRQRHEFWHKFDLFQFRMKTGELIRDLKNGVITPDQTKQDVSWRCVSGNGSWRMITHQYETFIDEAGVAYQLSRNLGVEAIPTPSDIVLR